MSVWIDIKYALRLLLKAPKFTGITLLVLTGGLAISLFTFSFLYSMLYKPLPLPNGESIYRVTNFINGNHRLLPAYELLTARKQFTAFKEFGVYQSTNSLIMFDDEAYNARGSYVEANFFPFTQVSPIAGRTIDHTDMQADAPPVVVLSFNLWQGYFSGQQQNSDPTSVIGKVININQTPTTVIGVMPKGYLFPVSSQLWLPMPKKMLTPTASSTESIRAFARLKPHVSVASANQEMTQAVNTLYQENVTHYQKTAGNITVKLNTFAMAQADNQGTMIFAFLNIVAFLILLLACINVGNLLLARAVQRNKETAIRAALGATSSRLISQLMWEGVIICVVGGILAVLLVAGALDFTNVVLQSELSTNRPFWWRWQFDFPTLLMAIAFTVTTIFLASFVPAYRATQQDINITLRDGTRGAQGRKAGRVSRFLVTVQIFIIALLMMIGGVSAMISMHLLNMDLGEDFSKVLMAEIVLPEQRYANEQQQRQFTQSLVDALNQQPNIDNAVNWHYIDHLPFNLLGSENMDDEQWPKINTVALVGKTELHGLRIMAGRHLSHHDSHNARRVIVVSESFVKRHWPSQPLSTALEQQIQLKINDQPVPFSIVGVISDRMNGSSIFSHKSVEDEVYISGYQYPTPWLKVKMKYSGNEKTAEKQFYQRLFQLDSAIENYEVRSAERNFSMMRSSMKLMANITFSAGAFALLLAVTGIYGITANAVVQRTHEIGIRRAVGASEQQLIKLFLRQGSWQLLTGLSVSLLLFSAISYIFYNFSEGHLPVYMFPTIAVTVCVLLTFVVLTAVYLPARKAVTLEPSHALRYE
ncbi:ABC transporter permease [Flocculibacter collagenilyticus]|uniref:ABC transporter permease n=1 Tax=Flocculibacter collagenilyticus TaxID=2744479 RepID=UPI0018F77ED7|nr:ABC transporter permease [Flocculibacter collagenilyticus]